jgi:phytanoyl-CoA hydroxylase
MGDETMQQQATYSRFGGLWIDRRDSEQRLELRSSLYSEEVVDQLLNFMRNGYVVIEGAVSKELTTAIKQDLERHWRHPPSDARIEHWEDGQQRFILPRIDLRDGATKLLDFHAFSDNARKAIAAPKVIDFLAAIFESKPKAFQTLTFWRGSQQAIHKDTAYVQVDGSPMHLAASWLALEDVQEGTGELEYYVGSHRAPDFLFAGHHKWMETAPHEHDQFLASLHEDAKKYNYRKSSFLAREGDVLIWHADLAHGGSPITKPDATRQSLVTHFTAEQFNPPYMRKGHTQAIEEGGCLFVSDYKQIGLC